ncbi:uncharacterized protein [Marmota flaviventris]|uniref:uncharacterized protein n=1 Tax=Marmota flaviventris TaxID=93162 RepID=UPI000FFFA82A|nr:uncharacterized protein LOC114085856 [Marmota flaviventris]
MNYFLIPGLVSLPSVTGKDGKAHCIVLLIRVFGVVPNQQCQHRRNLLEMQILRPHYRPTKPETLRMPSLELWDCLELVDWMKNLCEQGTCLSSCKDLDSHWSAAIGAIEVQVTQTMRSPRPPDPKCSRGVHHTTIFNRQVVHLSGSRNLLSYKFLYRIFQARSPSTGVRLMKRTLGWEWSLKWRALPQSLAHPSVTPDSRRAHSAERF